MAGPCLSPREAGNVTHNWMAICLAKVQVVVLLRGEGRGIDIWRQFAVSTILPYLALSTILYYSFL